MRTILAEAGQAPSARQIEDIVESTLRTNIHTHLYDSASNGLVGLTMRPQRLDGRFLDQIVYKWRHSRGPTALVDGCSALAQSCWRAGCVGMERGINHLLGRAIDRFCRA